MRVCQAALELDEPPPLGVDGVVAASAFFVVSAVVELAESVDVEVAGSFVGDASPLLDAPVEVEPRASFL